MRGRRLVTMLSLALLLLANNAVPARADESDYRIVGDVLIYLGVIPAAMVREHHPSTHTESLMHGGVPAGSDEYHVLIALFNAKTYDRISNAQISARVSEIGLAGERKTLQPMNIADTTTFGNFFQMEGMGPFEIEISIRIPGEPSEIDVTFEHRHE